MLQTIFGKTVLLVLTLTASVSLSQAEHLTEMQKACGALTRQTFTLYHDVEVVLGWEVEFESTLILHRTQNRVALVSGETNKRTMVSDRHFQLPDDEFQFRCLFQAEQCMKAVDEITGFLGRITPKLNSKGAAVDAEIALALRCAQARLLYIEGFVEQVKFKNVTRQ